MVELLFNELFCDTPVEELLEEVLLSDEESASESVGFDEETIFEEELLFVLLLWEEELEPDCELFNVSFSDFKMFVLIKSTRLSV